MSLVLIFAAAVVFSQPGGVFIEGEKVSWTGGEGLSVTDADGAVAKEPFGPGYYRVGPDTGFMVLPAYDHRKTRPYFGVTGPADKGAEAEERIAEVLKRLGLNQYHTMMNGKNFDLWRNSVEPFHRRGIAVDVDLYGAPKVADRGAKLPRKLVEAYKWIRDFTADYPTEKVAAWTVESESDCQGDEPAWENASFQKVACLAAKKGNPNAAVYAGCICLRNRSPYDEAYFRNDMSKYSDRFDFHCYSHYDLYPGIFGDLHALKDRYGFKGMPVTITENGTMDEGMSEIPPGEKVARHSPEQERYLAEFYVKEQVAAQMVGVSRTYFFFFFAYNEYGGNKDWGMFRRDGSAKPVCCSMATFVRQVGDAFLEGEAKLGAGIRGYVYRHPDGKRTLVYWATEEKGAALSLGVKRRTDWCGRAHADVRAERMPSYVRDVGDLEIVARPKPEGVYGAKPFEADEIPDIILSGNVDYDDFRIGGVRGYAEMLGDSGRMKLKVVNLTERAETGSFAIEAGTATGLPSSFTVEPMSEKTFDFVYTPPAGVKYEADFVARAFFGKRRTTRFVIPMRFEKAFESAFEAKPIANVWNNDTGADERKGYYDEQEKCFTLEATWKVGNADKWLYPLHEIKLPEESLDGADILQFEVKAQNDKTENDYEGANLMISNGKEEKYLAYRPPVAQWETRRVDLAPGGARMEGIRKIRIGINHQGLKVKFSVRNLRILRRKGDGK